MQTDKVEPGYKYCGTHMIFDIKMDGKFTRKARLVTDGHNTHVPSSISYSSVVSRESVRLALLIASLHDLIYHVVILEILNLMLIVERSYGE